MELGRNRRFDFPRSVFVGTRVRTLRKHRKSDRYRKGAFTHFIKNIRIRARRMGTLRLLTIAQRGLVHERGVYKMKARTSTHGNTLR